MNKKAQLSEEEIDIQIEKLKKLKKLSQSQVKQISYNIKQAAKATGLSEFIIRQEIKKGKIKASRLTTRKIVICIEHLEAYIKQGTTP